MNVSSHRRNWIVGEIWSKTLHIFFHSTTTSLNTILVAIDRAMQCVSWSLNLSCLKRPWDLVILTSSHLHALCFQKEALKCECIIHCFVASSLCYTWTVESISIWFNGIEDTALHICSVHFFICGRLEWHKYIKCAFHTSCTSCMVCGMLKIKLRQSRGYLNDHIVTRSHRWSYDEISILFHCRDDRNNAIWNRQLHSCCMWSTNCDGAFPDNCWQ